MSKRQKKLFDEDEEIGFLERALERVKKADEKQLSERVVIRDNGEGDNGGQECEEMSGAIPIPVAPAIEDVEGFIKTVSERVSTSEESNLKSLRKVKHALRRKRMEVAYEVIDANYRMIRESVHYLFAYTKLASEKIDDVARAIAENLIRDYVRMGVLPTSAMPLSDFFELREMIKDYMAKNEKGHGFSKTSILVGIGRNHVKYSDTVQYCLSQLCVEGFLERRKRRYYVVSRHPGAEG